MSKCSTCLKMSRYGYCDNMSSMDIGDRNPCVDGSMYEPRRFTNADRIRGMSDEELAVFFAKVDAALYRADLDVTAYRGEKVNANLDWLRQPAEEASDGQT